MADDPQSLRQLASRVLRPDASRYDDVVSWSRASLADAPPHTPSARLWSALAADGWIPRHWPGERHRRFDSARDVDLAWPPDLATAITLASDPEGVARVEALLLSSGRSLMPEGSLSPTIRWRVAPRERVTPARERPGRAVLLAALRPQSIAPAGLAKLFGAARELVEGVLGARASELEGVERPSIPGVDPNATFDGEAFEEALGYGVTQATAEAFARDVGSARHWARVRPDAPNPFSSLRRVWELGYAIDECTPEGFVVVAPELPLPPRSPWTRTTHVAGVFYVEPPVALHKLASGLAVRLAREPENPRDPRAIRVVTARDELLGYVPRDIASAIAPHLDAGVRHSAEITRVDPTSPRLERAIFIEITEG